jgi:glycosyltransferase involved in cell wall biosynthesis
MTISLLIIESHPVQYRTPVYTCLSKLCPGEIYVVFASDFSVRGAHDAGFATSITWDSDLLSGYPSTVLDTTLEHTPRGWNDLKAPGLQSLIRRLKPKAILLNSLNYRFDYVAYLLALWSRTPVWIRCETQDQALSRSSLKSFFRSAYYRLLYKGINTAFSIGELNRLHWLKHGLKSSQLRFARYCTPDRTFALSAVQKNDRRKNVRDRLGIDQSQIVVSFFGKLIPKKDPVLLFQAVPSLPKKLLQNLALLFVGSGELFSTLEARARVVESDYSVETFFPGFVNQCSLVDWYLASDVVVLPSRRAGETWGLVVNEALQAGCAVVVSDAVGCSADFGYLERFRTIPVGSEEKLAQALMELAQYPRSFDWAREALDQYSTESVAQALAAAICELG